MVANEKHRVEGFLKDIDADLTLAVGSSYVSSDDDGTED